MNEFLASIGVATVVTLLVEVLKLTGVVADGKAAQWATALNALSYGGFLVAGIYGFDPMAEDAQLVIQVLTEFLRFASQVLASPVFYRALRELKVL